MNTVCLKSRTGLIGGNLKPCRAEMINKGSQLAGQKMYENHERAQEPSFFTDWLFVFPWAHQLCAFLWWLALLVCTQFSVSLGESQ